MGVSTPPLLHYGSHIFIGERVFEIVTRTKKKERKKKKKKKKEKGVRKIVGMSVNIILRRKRKRKVSHCFLFPFF
jgi:hypothetical protein